MLLAQGHRDKKWGYKESTGQGCPKHLIATGLTDLALTDAPQCLHVILWKRMYTTRYIRFAVVTVLKSTWLYSFSSQYCLLASSSPLQAIPAPVSSPCPSPIPGRHWVSVEFWFPGGPLRCPTEPPGGYASLNKSRHSHGIWGGTHGPPGSVQCWRPLIAPNVAASQSSAGPSGNAGESTTAAQSILSPTVHWVQLPALPWLVYFRVMDAWERQRWSAVKTLLVWYLQMLWRAGSSHRGSMDYLQKQQTPLAFSQITRGVGESILFASTNNRAAGRERVLFLQSSFHPFPYLQAGQLFPSLDGPLVAPSFPWGTFLPLRHLVWRSPSKSYLLALLFWG